MSEFRKDFVFSEAEFEKLFKEFDQDGNGTVEKHEMAHFIQNLMLGEQSYSFSLSASKEKEVDENRY